MSEDKSIHVSLEASKEVLSWNEGLYPSDKLFDILNDAANQAERYLEICNSYINRACEATCPQEQAEYARLAELARKTASDYQKIQFMYLVRGMHQGKPGIAFCKTRQDVHGLIEKIDVQDVYDALSERVLSLEDFLNQKHYKGAI